MKNTKENMRQRKQRKIRRKGSPYLVLEEVESPPCIMKDTAYSAKVNVTNEGTGKATGIRIQAVESPFTQFADSMIQLSNLEPGQTKKASFDFKTSDDIRKNVYQVQFRASCSQSTLKTRMCYLRGGRIALLSDQSGQSRVDEVKSWLQSNNYPFEEIYSAAHLMTELYKYDLIIVASQQKMPQTWIKNLSTFVRNSQSILLISNISGESEALNETLGYKQPKYQTFSYRDAALEICKEHPVTKGLNVGYQIPLGYCTGNASIPTETTGTILAWNLNRNDGEEATRIPAITAKETGKGKIIHLNFSAQEHFDQIGQIMKNAVDWLLWG
jgi:hypothetical protein